MDDLEWLLTDDFVAFSAKIANVVDRKKHKKLELKAFYEKIQLDLKALDDEAAAIKDTFFNVKKGITPPVMNPPLDPVVVETKPDPALVDKKADDA